MTSELTREYRSRAALGMPHSDIREQMPVLYAWARHAARVIELGVRGGNSTSALLAALEGRGELWSVDISPPQVPAYWHELKHWHLMVSDDTSWLAVDFCPAGADVLFIDTSHFYDHTLAELRLYVPKVRPGGVVLMHDTGPGWPEVASALDVFCAAAGLDWYDHPAWPGLGVIEIPEMSNA
jgi:predicted O-methyltransferase YrrM